MARTLEEFDDDKLIPAFGFGDASTGDQACFPFHERARPSNGVAEVLSRYEELANTVTLSGPTSFAPVIHEAINIVKQEQSYHILVIIADGQVTDASSSGDTAQAIIEASHYPLSIVCIGVGDGPWDMMEHFDDELRARRFDNFQFVDFHACVNSAKQHSRIEAHLEARFALAALMEVPDQFAYIKQAGLLNASTFARSSCTGSRLAASPPTSLPAEPPAVSVCAVATPVPSAAAGKPTSHTAPPAYHTVVASSWGVAPAVE